VPRRPGAVFLVGVAAAALVLADVAALASRQTPAPDARTLLRRAQRYVDGAHTVRVDSTGRVEATDAGFGADAPTPSLPPGTGASFVQRYVASGVLVFPGDFHLTVDAGGDQLEAIRTGAHTYVRTASRPDPLTGERWIETEQAARQADTRNGIVRPDARADASLEIGPTVRQLVDAGSMPRIVARQRDATVLGVRIPASVFGGNSQFDRGVAQLAVGPTGRVERVVLDASGKQVSVSVTTRLSGWNAPAAVTAPPPAEIDTTPGVESGKLAAFHEAPLLQPRGIPEGWTLDSATVVSRDESESQCPEAELDYTDPNNDTGGDFDMYEFAANCADTTPSPGSRPFTAGAVRGWVVEEPRAGSTTIQVVVGATAIRVETDLSAADAAVLLRDMVPLDLAHPPASIPGIGRPMQTG